MEPIPACVLMVVALPCEAAPLITHYNLKRDHNESRFAFYRGENGINLIVSKVGCAHSATATTWGFSLCGSHAQTHFCNLGIGGCNQVIGSIFQASKIIDQASQQSFYPWLVPQSQLPANTVITLAQPGSNYQKHNIMDMEASGFYQSAASLVDQEQISIIKVIADNDPNSQQRICAKNISKLIQNNLSSITTHIDLLLQSSVKQGPYYSLPHNYQTILHHYHFSQYQKHQLKSLLQRWQSLQPNVSLEQVIEQNRQSKSLLHAIENILDNITHQWRDTCKRFT